MMARCEHLARSERLLEGVAAQEVLQPRAHERRALARFDVLEVDDGPDLVVDDHDGDAGAKIVGRDHVLLWASELALCPIDAELHGTGEQALRCWRRDATSRTRATRPKTM